MGLDGGDDAGHYVLAPQQAADFGLNAGRRAGAELAQELAVEAGVQPQAFGDGEDHLAVGDGKTDLFGHVHGGQQGAFLVAGGAGAALLAGKGHEHLVAALRAAHPGEALVQVAAGEKRLDGAPDDRPPKAVLGLEPILVDLLEVREVAVHHAPQAGGLGVAWAVEGWRGGTRRRHGRGGPGPVIVYTISLEQTHAICQPGEVRRGAQCVASRDIGCIPARPRRTSEVSGPLSGPRQREAALTTAPPGGSLESGPVGTMKTGTGTATNGGLDRATVQAVAEPVPVFIRPGVGWVNRSEPHTHEVKDSAVRPWEGSK